MWTEETDRCIQLFEATRKRDAVRAKEIVEARLTLAAKSKPKEARRKISLRHAISELFNGWH